MNCQVYTNIIPFIGHHILPTVAIVVVIIIFLILLFLFYYCLYLLLLPLLLLMKCIEIVCLRFLWTGGVKESGFFLKILLRESKLRWAKWEILDHNSYVLLLSLINSSLN